MSGFRKLSVLYLICAIILCTGIAIGIHNVNKGNYYENNFFANKRVEFSQYLPMLRAGEFEKISEKYLVAVLGSDEQNAKIDAVYNLSTVEVGTIVPVDALFQNKSNIFADEFQDGETGNISFVITHANQEVIVTFLFDLEEYNTNRKELVMRKCIYPILSCVIVVIALFAISLFQMRKNVFVPIKKISLLSRSICNGDYSQDYLQVSNVRDCADEMTDLISSFALMSDELKSQRETEERLKQSEKELISCMSHDLQTPLATIKAYTEGLRDHVATSEEEQQNYLGVILKKTDTMIEMIRDLLTYSNSQLGQLPMEYSDIMLQEYFHPLVVEMREYAKQKDVDFTYTLDKKNVCLHIDPKRMTQVFYNLIENAIKYMDKAQKKIDFSVKVEPGELHIRVQDNGRGISSEETLYIFDKFYRTEKSRTSSVPGAGLGLSICKYIVEQHNGKIWCESQLNVGSIFYLCIPLTFQPGFSIRKEDI